LEAAAAPRRLDESAAQPARAAVDVKPGSTYLRPIVRGREADLVQRVVGLVDVDRDAFRRDGVGDVLRCRGEDVERRIGDCARPGRRIGHDPADHIVAVEETLGVRDQLGHARQTERLVVARARLRRRGGHVELAVDLDVDVHAALGRFAPAGQRRLGQRPVEVLQHQLVLRP
jgi:hypothetical protein